jgi:hypothetical protein
MAPSDTDSFMRFLAAWALVHETADEGWKAAVERGASQSPGTMSGGPDAFVDGLSAMVAQEKERLKAALATGESPSAGEESSVGERMEELRFEVAELRGRIESMQATLDAIALRQLEG